MAKHKNTSSVPDHLASRLALLRKRIRKWDADALVVTNPKDIRYLTGFVGDDSWAVVPAKGNATFVLSDFRFDEQIKNEAPHVRAVMRQGAMVEALSKLGKKQGLRVFALPEDYLTVREHRLIRKTLGKKWVVAVSDGLMEQRSVKSADEVAAIRKALAIQQKALLQVLPKITPGRTEVEIAADMEHTMRSLGADGPSFPTIIAVDANGSLPHAIPGPRKVKAGSSVLIDWGARWGGYCSDLTRVVSVGKMAPKIREIYKVVLEAQLAGIDAIKPGVAMKDVDAAARKVIKKAGYGDKFGHSLGHGIGLNIHEEPRLSAKSEGVLKPGHVVTVEPGIYLPGVGGVRIEDDVLVTKKGGEVLSELPKTLDWAMMGTA